MKIWLCSFLVVVGFDNCYADIGFTTAESASTLISSSESSCAVCHGSNWQGNSLLGSPNLQILPNWYIRAQLESYQKGWRQRAQQQDISDDMVSVARALSTDQINIALKAKDFLKPAPQRVTAGLLNEVDRDLGETAFAVCAVCHGSDGLGQEALHAPPLAGQRLEYLKAQLEAFGEGARGSSKSDVFGQQMAKALPWPMSAETLDALLSYISTL